MSLYSEVLSDSVAGVYGHTERLAKISIYPMAWCRVVRSFLAYTPIHLRLPDLGRNQKMTSSCVPKTDTRLVILGVLMTMHERQDSTTPDHGIDWEILSILSPNLLFK